MIKERGAINAHWKHFEDLLSQDSFVNNGAVNSILQHPVRDNFAIPPALDEVRQAIKQVKNNMASGAN